MAKVLYIKANPKQASNTFLISDSFIKAYKEKNPADQITTLDLYREGIDILRERDHSDMGDPEKLEARNQRVFKYAYQFLEGDKYVIAAPFWNLSFPAILKAYIDYICISSLTFKYTEEGPVGLLAGRKAIYITTRGGNYSSEKTRALDQGEPYLKTILGFLGITDFTVLSADCLDVIGVDKDEILRAAIREAENLAQKF